MIDAEFVPIAEIDRARDVFKADGVVGVEGVYPEEDASEALAVAVGLARSWHETSPGQQTTTLTTVTQGRAPLYDVMQRMNHVGYRLSGASPLDSRTPFVQLVEQLPEAAGTLHKDNEQLLGVVAVTNLGAGSSLEFPDLATVFRIEPGRAVFQDPDRAHVHQGRAGRQRRTGLVISERAETRRRVRRYRAA